MFVLSQAKRQQRKLNFLITQTELYAHFMSGKASVGGPEGDSAQEEILRKLEDTAAQRQIDIGGGVMVNMGQEDYGTNGSSRDLLCYWICWRSYLSSPGTKALN